MTWSSSNYLYNTTITTGTTTVPLTFAPTISTYGPGPAIPPPVREPTPLEWLDREIEATCKLARLAS